VRVSCTSVRVLDERGAAIAEPDPVEPGSDLTHWVLYDSAVDVSYAGPA
jgi:hypothetical protein